MTDTIAALSTAAVPAGIGVLRLSGPGAIEAVERVFTPAAGAPMSARPDRLLVYGSLHSAAGELVDLCLCTVSRAPHSYTGEDTAELQCHGAPAVLRAGLEALFSAGARQAGPGEFTRRAFLNGRLDLTQAEAVADLIAAETVEAARCAAGQLGGAIRRKTDGIYDALRDVSSHFQAVVDYPDEDIAEFQLREYDAVFRESEDTLSALLRSFDRGKLLTGGVPTAIVGRPNVGKSTLLNTLLGYDRAIVSEIPGTTRDTITERVRLGGVLLRLTDTAGLRDTADAIERLGVERSRAALDGAELALMVVDATAEPDAEDRALIDVLRRRGRPWLLLLNKTDAAPEKRMEGAIPISARTGAGLEALERAVGELFPLPETAAAGEMLTNARQAEAVGRALRSISAARAALNDGMTPDAVLTETEEAMSALGELSGRTVREDITNRIFERFCVGK